MSGLACSCPGHAKDRRINWRIVDYRCNYSAFNGYHYTPSNYSALLCLECRHVWRTKARYTEYIKMLSNEERIRFGI